RARRTILARAEDPENEPHLPAERLAERAVFAEIEPIRDREQVERRFVQRERRAPSRKSLPCGAHIETVEGREDLTVDGRLLSSRFCAAQ
ncbi:MAG TPA: hypothetical protein VIM73_04015, partial [Polyangiaceae bacterium]